MTRTDLDDIARHLEKAVEHAGALSMVLAGEPTDIHGELPSIVHARIWAHGHSLLAILKSGVLDHSAALSLARMVLEAYVVFAYVTASVSDEEREFRRLLFKLHDTSSRINLMSLSADRSMYRDLLDGRKGEREQVKKHTFFGSLTKEQKERCLSGTQPYVRGFRRAALEAGIQERTFNSIYGYFSGHSHSAPISLLRTRRHKIDYFDPSEAQINMARLAVSIALPCILAASFFRIDNEPGLDRSWSSDRELRAILQEASDGLLDLR